MQQIPEVGEQSVFILWRASPVASKFLAGVLLFVSVVSHAQSPTVKVEQVMTVQEFQDAGLSALSSEQRAALNRWLAKYTTRVFAAARAGGQSTSSTNRAASSNCSPAIETTISGEFKGWDGETIFKLDNGSIWQQAEYDYTYSYAYRPKVTIYQVAGGCKMKVEDEEDTILVKKIN